jgi:hypothetical protein
MMDQEETVWKNYFHQHLTQHIVKKEKKKIDWKLVSCHPFLPIALVQTYPSLPWDWYSLSRLSFEKIQSLLTLFPQKQWDWNHLSSSSPLVFIQENPTLYWNRERLARRKYSFEKLLTPLDYILHNPQMPWNWKTLSRHPSLTMDHVFHHPTLPWDMDYIFLHCAFSSYHLSILPSHAYPLLSRNPHNTLDIVRQFIHKPWDWTELAQNIAFSPQQVHVHQKDFPLWRWDLSLRNPRLTWNFYHVIRREQSIHHQFHHLLKNHFHYSKSFLPYFTLVLRRFFLNMINRRRLLRKIHLLAVLHSKLETFVLRKIVFVYIG